MVNTLEGFEIVLFFNTVRIYPRYSFLYNCQGAATLVIFIFIISQCNIFIITGADVTDLSYVIPLFQVTRYIKTSKLSVTL